MGKIHSDVNKQHDNESKERPSTPYFDVGNENEETKEEKEHTTTLEEILSDRSSAMSLSIGCEEEKDDEIGEEEVDVDISPGRGKKAGPRRQRRIRIKQKRIQKKQKKTKLKKIREKIRKYEKLDFYEWVKEFYKKCCCIPMIRNRINEKFGADIGRIILSYLPSIIDEDDDVVMKEVMVDLMMASNDLSDRSRTFSDSYNDPLKTYLYDDDEEDEDTEDTEHIMDLYSTHNQSNHTTTNSNSTGDDMNNYNQQKKRSSLLDYDDLFGDAENAMNVDRADPFGI